MKYLLRRGACPNKQDTNGNTVLHMMVIHNQMVCKQQPVLYLEALCIGGGGREMKEPGNEVGM